MEEEIDEMEEEIDYEPLTLEKYKKIGEALRNAKKYMHVFLKLVDEANPNITNFQGKCDDLRDANCNLINFGYEIGIQMEEDYPEELELAHDLYF